METAETKNRVNIPVVLLLSLTKIAALQAATVKKLLNMLRCEIKVIITWKELLK